MIRILLLFLLSQKPIISTAAIPNISLLFVVEKPIAIEVLLPIVNVLNALHWLVSFYYDSSLGLGSLPWALSLVLFHVVNFTDKNGVLVAFEITQLLQNCWIPECLNLWDWWIHIFNCMTAFLFVHHVTLRVTFFTCLSTWHLPWRQRSWLNILWLAWYWGKR